MAGARAPRTQRETGGEYFCFYLFSINVCLLFHLCAPFRWNVWCMLETYGRYLLHECVFVLRQPMPIYGRVIVIKTKLQLLLRIAVANIHCIFSYCSVCTLHVLLWMPLERRYNTQTSLHRIRKYSIRCFTQFGLFNTRHLKVSTQIVSRRSSTPSTDSGARW